MGRQRQQSEDRYIRALLSQGIFDSSGDHRRKRHRQDGRAIPRQPRPLSKRSRTSSLGSGSDNSLVTEAAALLELVDRVLGDLAPRDGMFVGRRDRDGDATTIVIQTGGDGRYRLSQFDLTSPQGVEAFIAEAQAHLEEVFHRPLPLCPPHGHALIGQVREGEVYWVCPEGAWRCKVGEYEERTWPSDWDAGNMAAALAARLGRRGINGWRSIGFGKRGGDWIARVGLWSMDRELMDRIVEAASPIEVTFEPDREVAHRRL